MTSLLPPNATRLERALEAGLGPIPGVDFPIEQLWDPVTCPLPWLPWLAWSVSVDQWDSNWSEARKRQAVADSIALHRVKGTRASVEMVLADFDKLAQLVEWHEAGGSGTANTFDVVLPMVLPDGTAPGGERATAAFAEAVIREVGKVKPLREHMTLVQSLTVEGAVRVQGVGRVFAEARQDMAMIADTSPAWGFYLQTHDGEPLLDAADNTFLDTAP